VSYSYSKYSEGEGFAMRKVYYIVNIPRGKVYYIVNIPRGKVYYAEGLLYDTGTQPCDGVPFNICFCNDDIYTWSYVLSIS
jgi:hypothetical protein